MLSTLELRSVIESAFLPIRCCCRVESYGFLKVEIYDPESGDRKLLVTGISQSKLLGSQEINNLIKEIRAELHVCHEMKFNESVAQEVRDQKSSVLG